MKGKFRILGHVGLAVFVAVALMLAAVPAAKVEAATAITNVWVQFLTSTYNTEGAAGQFTIHFTPTTAMSRGVDTITVWFPDGSTAMGPAAFSLASAGTTAAYYEVDANGEATGAAVECTKAAVLSQSGYRITVTTPVDLAAGTACSLLIEDDAVVTCSSSTSNSPYYLKVYTSQDTTPVASDAFDLDTTGPDAMTVALTPATAGTAGQYTFTIDLGDTGAVVPVGGTVTIIFPYGTTIPSSIDAQNVKVSTDGGAVYESCTSAPTIDQKSRMITVTTPVQLDCDDSNNIVRFITAANIKNPTTATDYAHYYACTSLDELLVKASAVATITAGTATKIGFNNDSIPSSSYSDSSTMINMYSSILYVQSQDAYGNLKHVTTGAEPTVSFTSSQAGTGIFYDGVGSQISSKLLVDGKASIYYRDTTAGEVTITASATGYTSGTWTITIAAGVSLYDSSDNLIKTYAPTWASATAEATNVHSGDYIQNAINAAVAGDTVKLGGTAAAPAIYELDTHINLNKKVTLTSATSRDYTTIRPASEALNAPYRSVTDLALYVGISGTAANPVIIDGLTFDRLRSTVEFDQAIYNNGWNYVTVRNCTFNYIIPEYNAAGHEYGNVVAFIVHPQETGGQSATSAITSATISDNIFTNCVAFAAHASGEFGVITVMTKSSALASTPITGAIVSGNTMNNCNGLGISLVGYAGVAGVGATECYITANVTDNTLTNPVQGFSVQSQTHSCNILRNTVTGAYTAGIYVESWYLADHDDLVIKNNTFTGCAGAAKKYFSSNGVVVMEADGDTTAGVGTNVVQYNDISNNDAEYSIYVTSGIGAQDCKYNYFGDATGPYYSALAGATVAKSNTGGAGKKVTDLVTYYPWLHKSKVDVVNDNASYQACTMKLVSGWNTLSTPVQLISTADTIGDLIPAHMTLGYYYDVTGWQLLTGAYELKACDAVYVKMSIATDVLLKFDAKTTSTPSKALTAGWNLMSLAYLSSSGKSDLATVASVKLTAAGLPGYSQLISPSMNATQTNMYGVAGTSWAYSSGESATSTCFAGLGYWIYMQNAATLAGFEITPIAPDLD